VIELSGFAFETLRTDGALVLCRGHRVGAASILVVMSCDPRESPADIRRLEHENSLARLIDSAWALRPLGLSRHDGRTILVLEDPGGIPLDQILKQPLELTRFLRIAVALSVALHRVHRSGLIHKAVRPANVLVDGANNVRLTGFGSASRLPLERQAPTALEVIDGSFAYMAPEQTGRMNRSIDARSDLYSLGVTMYEMITGQRPFLASDPMELIHCHLARYPTLPSECVCGIPEPVDAIVLRLLAKNAEDRYQTAAGVEADLQRCLASWEIHRCIESFTLGARDAPAQLVMPEKLYGRENAIEALMEAFEHVVAHGNTELVLVSGYSGIGKSSIVSELRRMLASSQCLFALGKFDQHKRDIPYATLTQAFLSLVLQLLSKNDVELGRWRAALLEPSARMANSSRTSSQNSPSSSENSRRPSTSRRRTPRIGSNMSFGASLGCLPGPNILSCCFSMICSGWTRRRSS
jgi:serine/threonine protein kinase